MKILSQDRAGRAVVWVIRFVSNWVPPLAAWVQRRTQTWAGRARDAYLGGDLKRAEAYYREAIAWQPHDADLHSALGQVHYEQSKPEDAENQFRKALEYDYRNLRALKGLGVVLQEGGELLETMYLYLRYLELQPKDAGVCLNLGVVFHELGKYESAVEYYRQAEKEDPDDTLIFKNHALALLAIGRAEEARDKLLQAGKIDPEDAEVDRLLGSALDALGDFPGALQCYESAVKKDPNDADSHLQFAYGANRLERFREAADHAQTALDLFRQNGDIKGCAQAFWELGWDNYMLDDWNASLQAGNEALKLNPDLTPVHFNLGLALLQMGRVAEARNQYKQGIDRSAQVADLKIHAIDDLREALDKNPKLTGAAEILAMLEEKYATLSRDLAKAAQPSS